VRDVAAVVGMAGDRVFDADWWAALTSVHASGLGWPFQNENGLIGTNHLTL
jgi:hypothetical protein